MSMGSSSCNSGVRRTRGLPLIDCPSCGQEQLRLLQSSTIDNPGKFFVKCPQNEKGKKVIKDCAFFMWLEQYRQFIGELGMLNGDEQVAANLERDIIWRSIEVMRVEVSGMSGRINKLGKTVELQFIMLCFVVFVVVLVLLVILVK